MKKINSLFLFFILLSTAPLYAAVLTTLTAKQATGGALMKTNLNDSAVYFPTANPANDRIVWAVPGTLPAGIYQLDIDFYQPSGVSFSVNEYISFEAAGATQLAFLDFYYLGISAGTITKSIGFYTPNVLSTIALIKSSQRNLNTFGIRAIRISAGTEAAITPLALTFQLPVTGSQVAVPMNLPTGTYSVTAAIATATTWTVAGGSTVTTPASKTNRIYIEQGAKPAVLSGGPVTSIMISHFPTTTPPNMSTAGVAPLLTIADTTKIETRTLKLIGYTGTSLPQLDVFPEGKKVAVVSSWDDGGSADLQLLDSLVLYGVKGSFMLNATSTMMSKLSLLESKGIEIGAHSWSHPFLYNSSPQRCLDEVVECRRLLESKLGYPVISFAYPYDYSPAYDVNGDYVLRAMRSAGYWYGRSTGTGSILGLVDAMTEPLAMKPTAHFNVGGVSVKTQLDAMLLKPGSVFHLWGHSYELATSMVAFRSSLAAISNNPSVWYATLGDLMLWKYTRKKLLIEPYLAAVGDKTFTLKMPWLHASLRRVPVSLVVPAGVTAVEWEGVQYPVVNSRVQLMWGLPTATEYKTVTAPAKYQISTTKNRLEVENIAEGEVVKVYNLSGIELAKQKVDGSLTVTFNLTSGVYLVGVGNDRNKVVVL